MPRVYLWLLVLLVCTQAALACLGSSTKVGEDYDDGDHGHRADHTHDNSGDITSDNGNGDNNRNGDRSGGDDSDQSVNAACKSRQTKDIIDRYITDDPTESSRAIQRAMVDTFGGNAEVICSDGDFAWSIWYAKKKQCKFGKGSVKCLAWLD